MRPLSGNQRLGLLTSLMEMSLVLRLPRDMHLRRSFSNAPRLPLFLHVLRNPHALLTFGKGAESIAHSTPSHILTSKSGPGPSVFNTFDLRMFFAPQRHALVRHLECQNRFGSVVFLVFWLPNLLRATAACNFWSLIRPHVSALVPPQPQNSKNTVIDYFSIFSHNLIFFLRALSLLTLSLLPLSSLIDLTTVAAYVGSLWKFEF